MRELVVLGTASQVPTRHRAHNGYVLRWDGAAILFDPGEGTQRQFTLADLSPATVTHVCITHLHGDHCLGLPGMLQRFSLDEVTHPIHVHYPASGQPHIDAMQRVAAYDQRVDVRYHPSEPGVLVQTDDWRIEARELDHRIDTLGYRLVEPDGVRMLPERLDELGVHGADRSRLHETGAIEVDGRTVTLDEVSEHRRGQRFAFVMDTRDCAGARQLAEGADLLVAESTFLDEDVDLADRYQHLTARQAATIARDAGARRLVLTHFSQRYALDAPYGEQARAVFDDVVVAHDLMRIAVPPRA